MIRKIGIVLAAFFVLQANAEDMGTFVQSARQCQDLACTKTNIENIDSQIVALIGQRLAFSQRAAQLGQSNETRPGVHINEEIERVALEAQNIGYPPQIARVVIGALITQTNFLQSQN